MAHEPRCSSYYCNCEVRKSQNAMLPLLKKFGPETQTEDGLTILEYAVRNQRLRAASFLTQQNYFSPLGLNLLCTNAGDIYDWLFHEKCLPFVLAVIKRRGDLTIVNENNESILVQILRLFDRSPANARKIILALFQNPGGLPFTARDKSGKSAWTYLCELQEMELLANSRHLFNKTLESEPKTFWWNLLRATDSENRVSEQTFLSVMKLLHEMKADFKVIDEEGNSLIQRALKMNKWKHLKFLGYGFDSCILVKDLIAKGVDLNHRNPKTGSTAFVEACVEDLYACTALFFKHEAVINSTDTEFLFARCTPRIKRLLMQEGLPHSSKECTAVGHIRKHNHQCSVCLYLLPNTCFTPTQKAKGYARCLNCSPVFVPKSKQLPDVFYLSENKVALKDRRIRSLKEIAALTILSRACTGCLHELPISQAERGILTKYSNIGPLWQVQREQIKTEKARGRVGFE
eukprot:m.70107 g.70107  ORF g.70107 m.70107 type:complete len:461 (-) comp20045_c0_seq2:26-1408(-)